MRWDDLFADLEAQAEVLEQAERRSEVDERTRGLVGAIGLVDRARAAVGAAVRVRSAGGLAISGTLARVGPDWLLLDEDGGRETLLLTAHLVSVRGLTRFAALPDSGGVIAARLGVRHALRGIARDRSGVRVHLIDGTTVDATLDRVGADFVEAATHAPGESRRRHDVRDVEVIPFAAVVAVRRTV